MLEIVEMRKVIGFNDDSFMNLMYEGGVPNGFGTTITGGGYAAKTCLASHSLHLFHPP